MELATKILSRSESLDHAIRQATTLANCCHTAWDKRRYDNVLKIFEEMKK
jgi:CO dehydrogenase/acetyl-CoA synthase alpha subunit